MSKQTPISEIGKNTAIDKLFDGSGYVNEKVIVLKEKGECCTCHKNLLEGVDFDLTYNPLKHLGYKAVLYVIGNIYARFFKPVSLCMTIGLSNRFSFEDVQELWSGVLAAAKEHDIKHISLDLIPSASGLVLSLSSCGVLHRSVLEKLPSFKSFDLICLTGDVGAAYMGLHVLEREKVAFNAAKAQDKQPDLSKYKYILGSYLNPQIPTDILERFRELEIYPSGGYFVSRSLGGAIKQLAKDSGFGAKIFLNKIPIASATLEMAKELNIDAVTAAINGGDDYRFIFTIPIEKHETIRKEFQDFDVIGHLAKPDIGTVLVTPEGAELELSAQGW